MKIPLMKSTVEFISQNDEDYVQEAIELLEHVSQAKGLADEELNVIGELLSNFYGAIEVNKEIKKGTDQKDALNSFMKRVLGSIDR
jgi:predicted DNA-binding protein